MTLHDFMKATFPDLVIEVLDRALVNDIFGKEIERTDDSYNLRRVGNGKV